MTRGEASVSAKEESSDLAQEGLAHLQAAAKEMIAAARSFLDVAETLVEDPQAVQALGGAVTTLAKLAAGTLLNAAEGGADDGGEPRVQRIRVG
jgi:F420-dependent methylenetetrahydromethanopterin dehydrogenase